MGDGQRLQRELPQRREVRLRRNVLDRWKLLQGSVEERQAGRLRYEYIDKGIIYSPEMGIKKGIFMNNELVEIMIEEEPVIKVPINLRRKKLKTKMKSRSVSNRLIYSRKSVVPMTSKLKQHAPAEMADKMIRNHVARSKNYSSRTYSQNSSYRVLAGSPKKS